MKIARDYAIGEVERQSPHIAAVARWLYEEWGRSQGYDLSDTLAWCQHLAAAENESIIVATRHDRLIGALALVQCDLAGHEHLKPWLSSFYLPPAERGGTVGQSLIGAACDWAGRKRYSNLHLFTRKGKLTAYYHRYGWLPMHNFTRDGEVFQIMRRPLFRPGAVTRRPSSP